MQRARSTGSISANPSACGRSKPSEAELQGELHDAPIGGAGDQAEAGDAQSGAGCPEERRVGGVEKFAAQLKDALLVRQPNFTFSNALRNAVQAPGLTNLDLAIYKMFPIDA